MIINTYTGFEKLFPGTQHFILIMKLSLELTLNCSEIVPVGLCIAELLQSLWECLAQSSHGPAWVVAAQHWHPVPGELGLAGCWAVPRHCIC